MSFRPKAKLNVKFYRDEDIQEILKRVDDICDDLADKNVIITGARGFLGRYFIEIFKRLNQTRLDKPVHVIAIDNFITSGDYGNASIEDQNIEFIQHDVIQPLTITQNVDYIIHAAGIASPQYYQKYPLETLQVAINGTKNMLELARQKNSKFIFFSSSEIYGDPDPKNIPTKEDYRGNVSSLGPRACYDESKRVGETLCYIFGNYYGVKTNMVRPFNFYGPGMQERDFRVLPNFASKIKAKKPLRVYGNGKQTRTYCYITDALTGLLKITLRGIPNEVYNIGNDGPEISVIQLVEIIKQKINRNINYEIIAYPSDYPTNDPSRRCPDISKAKEQLGFEPLVKLEDGLRRFLSWTELNYAGEQ